MGDLKRRENGECNYYGLAPFVSNFSTRVAIPRGHRTPPCLDHATGRQLSRHARGKESGSPHAGMYQELHRGEGTSSVKPQRISFPRPPQSVRVALLIVYDPGTQRVTPILRSALRGTCTVGSQKCDLLFTMIMVHRCVLWLTCMRFIDVFVIN